MADVNNQIRLIILLLLFLFEPVFMNGNEAARAISIKKRDRFAQFRRHKLQKANKGKVELQNSRTPVSYSQPRTPVAKINSYNGNRAATNVISTGQQGRSNHNLTPTDRYGKSQQPARTNTNSFHVQSSSSVNSGNNQVNHGSSRIHSNNRIQNSRSQNIGNIGVGVVKSTVHQVGSNQHRTSMTHNRNSQQDASNTYNHNVPSSSSVNSRNSQVGHGSTIIRDNNRIQNSRASAVKPINSFRNPCNPNPCLNGGTCKIQSSNDGGYECDCRHDFRGKYCHEVTVKCDLLGCDKTKDCVSTPLGGTCICVINNVGKICTTDTGLSSEWDKIKMVVSERTVHGTETVLGIVASVVVFVLFVIIHCHRVNSRRSIMQKKYETAKKEQPSVDPPPGWCDVSSHVLRQTFCCKSGSIVDNYLPVKGKKEKKTRKKKKEDNQKQTKAEDGVGSNDVDIEITKRHNSRTGFRSNKNQSGNQSENNTRSWKTRSGHSPLAAGKLLRNHSSAKPQPQYQPIYFDEEQHMFREKLNQKTTRRNNILDKELERRHRRRLRTRVNKSERNFHSRLDNLESETNVVDEDDCDQYINEDTSPQLSEATSKTNLGKGIKVMRPDWFDHSHNTQTYCTKLDCNNVKEWSAEERRVALEKHIDDDDEIIVARKKMGAIEHKMPKVRKSIENRQADIKQTHQETEIADTMRDEWFQNNEHCNNPNVRQMMEYLDYCNTAHDGKDSLATFDNKQKETGENVCQNRNVNTNIEEPLFSVQHFPSYYSDSNECNCLDSNDNYSFDNNPVYNYLADRQFRQDTCGFTYGNFNETTDTQTFAEDVHFLNEDRFSTTPLTDYHLSKEKSEKIDYYNRNDDNSLEDQLKTEPKIVRIDEDVHLCLSELESRQFYHVPDRELYGIWSTTIEIPDTAQDDEYKQTLGNTKESLQGIDIKGREQKITQSMSPAYELDASTDQHYLKSFEKDGQKLYYVDGDSPCTQLNFNQNHEQVNYADSMLSDHNAMHENVEHNVDNKVFFSPIDTDLDSDNSDDCVSDTISTLVASATDSEAYASEDNTLVATSETEI